MAVKAFRIGKDFVPATAIMKIIPDSSSNRGGKFEQWQVLLQNNSSYTLNVGSDQYNTSDRKSLVELAEYFQFPKEMYEHVKVDDK